MHTSVVQTFADLGVMAADDGVLPDALTALAQRLDDPAYEGLLDLIVATCFTKHTDDGICPLCGHKQDPGKPHPKPAPPPKPPQPKGPGK